jgi:programmed cell death protein 5
MEEEEELEEIRRRKMLELQEQRRREEMRRELELQKRLLLQQILTPEARSRLANLRMVKPEFAEALELELIALAQSGRLRAPLTDLQLKELLKRLQEKRKETRIRRV